MPSNETYDEAFAISRASSGSASGSRTPVMRVRSRRIASRIAAERMSAAPASGVTVNEYRSGNTTARAGVTASAPTNSAATARTATDAVRQRARSLRIERDETLLPFIRLGPVAPRAGRLLYRPTPQAHG